MRLQQTLAQHGLSVASLFEGWMQRAPDKPFLVWAPFDGADHVYSYAEFWNLSGRLATGLAARGLQPGERLLLHADNSPEFLLSWLACARLGVVVVTTNTRCSAGEMAYFLEKSRTVAAITQGQYAAHFESVQHLRLLVICDGEPGKAAIAFTTLLDNAGIPPAHAAEPLDDLSIQFTSGTTSRPKGVVWTEANALWAARLNALHFALRHDDVCAVHLPLYHTNAQSYSLLGTLWVGGTLLLQPRFSARHFWRAAVDYRATWMSTIPFCVKALLQQPVPEQHSFRLWITAVALPTVADAHFRVRTMGLWGMTETITQGIVGDLEHPGPDMCIGRASPGYEICISHDDGTHVQPGETGALFVRGVRGVSLFKEYLDEPEASTKCFDDDGWFETGDRVRVAEDGNLFFMDRDKDMLKVGGENVSAAEIEAVIMASNLVEECAVVGQKHFMLDEVPVAFVVARPDAPSDIAARLSTLVREQLADFKAVRAVHVVDTLPRSTLEKISKKELRDRLPEITQVLNP